MVTVEYCVNGCKIDSNNCFIDLSLSKIHCHLFKDRTIYDLVKVLIHPKVMNTIRAGSFIPYLTFPVMKHSGSTLTWKISIQIIRLSYLELMHLLTCFEKSCITTLTIEDIKIVHPLPSGTRISWSGVTQKKQLDI